MQECISSLYSKPSALVKTNYIFSHTFPMHNGTWQAWLLSSLIFILTLEPFLRMITAHLDIRGITSKGGQHKLPAYADDLIFFETSHLISLPSLLNELCLNGTLSNFKINYTKLEAMSIEVNPTLQHYIGSQFDFRWTNSYNQYLGTNILCTTCIGFFNLTSLAHKLKSNFQQWDREVFM